MPPSPGAGRWSLSRCSGPKGSALRRGSLVVKRACWGRLLLHTPAPGALIPSGAPAGRQHLAVRDQAHQPHDHELPRLQNCGIQLDKWTKTRTQDLSSGFVCPLSHNSTPNSDIIAQANGETVIETETCLSVFRNAPLWGRAWDSRSSSQGLQEALTGSHL